MFYKVAVTMDDGREDDGELIKDFSNGKRGCINDAFGES
jgi:hypothetical protein